MAKKSFRSYAAITIPANGSETIHIQGRYISCYAADANFQIGLDDGVRFDFFAGAELLLPDSDPDFQQVDLINDTGAAIDVSLAMGFGEFRDRRFSFSGVLDVSAVQVKAATLPDTADVSLVATATTIIKAINLNRREIIIANLPTNTQTMRIGASTAGAARGIPLQPGQSITLAATAAVYGYNPGGSAESVAVVEVED